MTSAPAINSESRSKVYCIEVVPTELLQALADEAPKENRRGGATVNVHHHSTSDDRQTALATLTVLDPSMRYEDWMNTGRAMHSVDPSSSMLTEWDAWSKGSDKYIPGKCAEKWNEFKSGGGVGIGTLCYMATATGKTWKPSRPAPKVATSPAEVATLTGADASGEGQGDADLWTHIATDQGRTELSAARRFVLAFGEDVRFCHAWSKWFSWDGARWKLDDDGAVQRMATTVADAIWHQVANFHTEDTVDFAMKISKSGGINAMLKLAASMLPIRVDELDTNHWLLNCPNGTLDLRTGTLRPHRREDNLTKLCPTNYTPDAGTLSFDQFLDGVFDGSSTLIDFLQRLFGYAITGDVREQCLPIFYGEGSNGKSTLLTAIQDTLGIDYSTTAPPSLLMEKKTDTHPTELAGLFGKRLVVAQETNQGAKLAESTVKQLTGGDRVSARRMKEDFWEFNPTHKLLLCTNHKPRVKGTDHAIWRRLLLIPFARKFWNPAKGETGPEELRQDKELTAKLKAEAEGILAWMVQGCLAWQRDGLQVPVIVRAATEIYQSESDIVGRFVGECCLRGDSYRIKFSALFDALKKWCDELGNNLPSRRMVGEWLENRFERQLSSGTWYRGITTKPDVDENRNQYDPFEEAKSR